MIFDVWKMKKLDKGVVTDMAEQRKHNLGTYRVTGMGTTKPICLTEPKAGSEFRGMVTKSLQWGLSVNECAKWCFQLDLNRQWGTITYLRETSKKSEIKTGRRNR